MVFERAARQWGGIAKNRIRLIGYDRQYKIRVCKECGELELVASGFLL